MDTKDDNISDVVVMIQLNLIFKASALSLTVSDCQCTKTTTFWLDKLAYFKLNKTVLT